MKDLLSHARPGRIDRPDAAAQTAAFMQRDKHGGALPGQLPGQIIRQPRGPPGFYKTLNKFMDLPEPPIMYDNNSTGFME